VKTEKTLDEGVREFGSGVGHDAGVSSPKAVLNFLISPLKNLFL
jgi:hypothetical protein